jgi:hypothetical protein
VPLLNWYSLVPFGKEKTLIIVPVSEAVANNVPSLFNAMHDKGARCASTTLSASNFKVSNIRTSPVVGGTKLEGGGACEGRLSPVSSLALGRGYARKQFSEDGASAQIALGFGEVAIVYSRVMFEISYRYISSSKTTANRFRLSRTARTAEGNVSSQMIEDLCKDVSTRTISDIEAAEVILGLLYHRTTLPLCFE